MFFVYLLESEKNGRYYIGQTQDLRVRLAYHNHGRCRYTKNNGPWKMIGYKSFSTRSEAMQEERRLKKMKNKFAINREFKIEA